MSHYLRLSVLMNVLVMVLLCYVCNVVEVDAKIPTAKITDPKPPRPIRSTTLTSPTVRRLQKFKENICGSSTKRRKVQTKDKKLAMINTLFPGLFKSRMDISRMEIKKTRQDLKFLNRRPSTDRACPRRSLPAIIKLKTLTRRDNHGSLCCHTKVAYFKNATLINVNGQTRNVVHFDDENLFQYIPHGYCSLVIEYNTFKKCLSYK